MKMVRRAVETPLSNKHFRDEQVGEDSIGPDGGRVIGHENVVSGAVDCSLYRDTVDENGIAPETVVHTYDMLKDPALHRLIEKYGS
ncbi:hypothetical protein [Mycolicibacterium chubuense]|nr:hypothetical protein [Mycolicibacterium chubuense]